MRNGASITHCTSDLDWTAGVIIVTYVFCKAHKLNTFTFLDFISLSAPIGIFFGRLANFLNSELYGRQTDILWSVKWTQDLCGGR